MKKKIFLAFISFVMLAIGGYAQTKLVEKVSKNGSEVVIPYEKYVLSNGLTLIVHEDHSDPIAHVDITYHVGSAREQIGKSGFAHFFEHMLFQGSDNVADEQHFKIISEAGGTANGSTNRDRTNYYQTVPSNHLEKILWLESDRMGFFLDAVTQRKFEIQRSTVKNEKGQRYDNVPYGNLLEVNAKNIYPYGHPYSWLTIGFEEDLNRVDVNDLKNFFLRWYGPNNAVLTIGGDVKTAEVVRLVEKYFGGIKRGPLVEPTKLPMPVIEKDRFVSMTDNHARLPLLSVAYPTIPNYHSDLGNITCLTQVLGQGKNSALYQYITKKQLALNVVAFHNVAELAGELNFRITPPPGKSLEDEWKLFKAALDSFEVNGGVKDDDIEKFKGSIISSVIGGLQSVSGKVSLLAEYETFTGNPNKLQELIKMYQSVTKESVMAAYNKYIKGKAAVVVSVVPKNQQIALAAADNYKIDSSNYTAPEYGYTGLKYEKNKETFDRSKIPVSAATPQVYVPKFWRKDLPNGIKMIGTENNEIPLVNIFIEIPGGHLAQDNNRSKIGLARIFGAMMNEDTKNYTGERMASALQKLGSSLAISSSATSININIQTLRSNLAATMALVEERLFRPDFTEAAFNRIKKQVTDGFRLAKANPGQVADMVFAKVNYGTEHILGFNQSGNEETVKNITIADVQSYYDNYLTTQGTKVVIVGDVPEKEILPALSFLNKLPNKKITLPVVPPAPVVDKTKVYVVDIPKSAQSEFRIGYATGLKYDATGDYYKAGLMNYVLGGNFNSRLSLNLREDKGWTYGASSVFSGDEISGDFQFNSSIRGDATDSALTEVMKEFNNYVTNGITEEELTYMKNSIGQREALRYETGFQKAGFIGRILDYNLPANYVSQQTKILAAIKKKEVDALAKNYLRPDKMNILLVGDRAKIFESVKKLGYSIIELDVDGNKIERKGF